MRARTINENNFERNQDPKDLLKIGRYKDNPMPQLNSFIKNKLSNPKSVNFKGLSYQFEKTKEELIGLIFIEGIKEEFGSSFLSSGKDEFTDFFILEGNIKVSYGSSNDKTSFYPIVEFSGKDNYLNGPQPYCSSVELFIKAVRKILKLNNIDL